MVLVEHTGVHGAGPIHDSVTVVVAAIAAFDSARVGRRVYVVAIGMLTASRVAIAVEVAGTHKRVASTTVTLAGRQSIRIEILFIERECAVAVVISSVAQLWGTGKRVCAAIVTVSPATRDAVGVMIQGVEDGSRVVAVSVTGEVIVSVEVAFLDRDRAVTVVVNSIASLGRTGTYVGVEIVAVAARRVAMADRYAVSIPVPAFVHLTVSVVVDEIAWVSIVQVRDLGEPASQEQYQERDSHQ
jgi:hypothetical protein